MGKGAILNWSQSDVEGFILSAFFIGDNLNQNFFWQNYLIGVSAHHGNLKEDMSSLKREHFIVWISDLRPKRVNSWSPTKRPWFMLRGCGKGKRLGRKKYSLRPCLSFLYFSYRLSPPPSVTEYFSPWPISGQKVLDNDKTVYKDVLNNRLLCPPPAYPMLIIS